MPLKAPIETIALVPFTRPVTVITGVVDVSFKVVVAVAAKFV